VSRRPRDLDELRELAGDDWRDAANTMEADGRAEKDPTKVEEARMIRRAGPEWDREAKAATAPHIVDDEDAPKKKASTGSPRRKSKSTKAKRRGKVGTAARKAAVGEPADRTASAITKGGSIFWTIALGTVALILIANVITNADRAAKLIGALGAGAERIVYPRTAFPERATAAKAPTKRRTVPTNPATRSPR
jgi:hypothetical protein